MNVQFSLPIWVARCQGNRTNCLYPDAYTVTDAEALKRLVANDHTFICLKNSYRSEENFSYTETLVTDCDNTHSDNPDDWITKEDIMNEFPDVAMLIYTSRNHMKPKDGKSPRPKYHVVFFVERITSPEDYKRLMQKRRDFSRTLTPRRRTPRASSMGIPVRRCMCSRGTSTCPCSLTRTPLRRWTGR